VAEDARRVAEEWASAIARAPAAAVRATKRLALFPTRLTEAERVEIAMMRDAVERQDHFRSSAAAFGAR
jgi:hypothetical protein